MPAYTTVGRQMALSQGFPNGSILPASHSAANHCFFLPSAKLEWWFRLVFFPVSLGCEINSFGI